VLRGVSWPHAWRKNAQSLPMLARAHPRHNISRVRPVISRLGAGRASAPAVFVAGTIQFLRGDIGATVAVGGVNMNSSSKPIVQTPVGSHALAASACCLLLVLVLAGCGQMREGSGPEAIWSDPALHQLVPARVGAAHTPTPLARATLPQHPFMAPRGKSNMHVDSFTSNTYAWAGPLGRAPQVASRAMGVLGGECPTINFDGYGHILTVCVQHRVPSLLLLEPNTLRVLARHELPARRTPLLRLRKIMNDTSGGAYFYVDHQNRAVVGTADGTIEVIAVVATAEGARLQLERRIDLADVLRLPDGELDKVTAVLPDFRGNYWFVARYGTVGVVNAQGKVRATRLIGEEIENSFSVGPDGVYIVSDHALYRFDRDAQGGPYALWRETYDRGTRRKVGQINQGSGTTPTLLGDDYVAIADNAAPRMNVVVMRRGASAERRIVCRTPVFAHGKSATENTFIGYGRSLIVENNAGYDLFSTMRGGKTSAPGVARIDVREDGTGCDVVWESQEVSQTTVPKLSTETGLIYLYTKLPNAPQGADAYYFTAISYETGKTVYRVLTGTGVRYDNNWAAIALAPDGSAFVGVLNGLVRVRDAVPPLPVNIPSPQRLLATNP
jgi:hypothetical protein